MSGMCVACGSGRVTSDPRGDYCRSCGATGSYHIKYGPTDIPAKDTNPKDAIGTTKLPMHLIPGTAKTAMALAYLEGALKYGKYNWRIAGVRSSVYLDALERHLEKYKNGEDSDAVTGVPHLGSIMACCGIILDAALVGKLNDDRPPMAKGFSGYVDNLQHHVIHLQKLFEDEDPHQCTIQDTFNGVDTEQS